MVSIIEKAVQRLEQLKRAGIDLPRPRLDQPSPISTATRASARSSDTLMPHAVLARERDERDEQPPPAVELDRARLANAGYIVDPERSQLGEEFRMIKRPLLRNARGVSGVAMPRANLVMVTSAIPGEGKTFTAINLALSIASEEDTTVLLVDADTPRPAVFERLGIERTPGLLDLLENGLLRVERLALRTSVPNLSLLSSGTPNLRANELLASAAMSRLLDQFADGSTNLVVIFDAPPLLPTAEARELATRMGQVLFVVEAERTPQSAVTDGLATLSSCQTVMTVLNKARRSALTTKYGYYDYANGY